MTTLEQVSDTLAAENGRLRRELDMTNQENMLLRARVSSALASGTVDPTLAPISMGEFDYLFAMLPDISGPAPPGTHTADDCPAISGSGSYEAWLVTYPRAPRHCFQHRPESVPPFPERWEPDAHFHTREFATKDHNIQHGLCATVAPTEFKCEDLS